MKRTTTSIRGVWERRAEQEGDDPHCTLPDYHLRHLEAAYISRHLRSKDSVLDIGCGNGTTTAYFAEHVHHMIGGDYAPTMIAKAKKLHVRANLEFRIMNVLQLDVPDATFDTVISERCLINLPNWNTQKSAIREIARVLKPGGMFLLCESYEEAFARFATLRRQFGLLPMRRHPQNVLLREELLQSFVKDLFGVHAIEKMGLYYLISRIVHPLLVAPSEPHYSAPINDVAVRMTLEMDPTLSAEFSVNGLYVLQRQ